LEGRNLHVKDPTKKSGVVGPLASAPTLLHQAKSPKQEVFSLIDQQEDYRGSSPPYKNIYITMPPRSLSERSPVSVMRWDDESISSLNMKPTSPRKSPLSKGVRFSDKNEVFPIQHLDDMTDEEVYAIWYTSREYSEIKQAYQVTIFMMESGEEVSGDEHTSRGLEYRTQEGAWARYENKRDAYNAVLDEQDRQWKVDKDDYDKIRQIYLKHSTKCANAAIVRALQDERDIQDYMKEEVKVKKTRKVKKTIIVKKKKSKDKDATEATSDKPVKGRLVRKEVSKTPGSQ
jgi:hypothetical protein